VCAGKHADIEARAIAENWDAGRTELEILRPTAPSPGRPLLGFGRGVETIERRALRMARARWREGPRPAAMEQGERLGATCCWTVPHGLDDDGRDAPRGKMDCEGGALHVQPACALGNVATRSAGRLHERRQAGVLAAVRNVRGLQDQHGHPAELHRRLDRVAPGGS